MPMKDSTIFSKDGNTLTIAYPTYNCTIKANSRIGVNRWNIANVLTTMVVDLASDSRKADLDLFHHLDLQERRIDRLQTDRNTDLKTINENFRLHRELIDGFTEIFANQQAEIDGLWKVVNRQKAQIEVLAKLDAPETT